MKKNVNGIEIDMTAEEIAEFESQQIKIDNNIIIEPPYKNQRKNAYPEIGDQLDMLWHSIDQNAELKQK